ncbi:hypothetical protein P73_3256 [Celeribacter indicus]|uniref:Uncharacterized protein n=1 Tax=Celeribacter indicus TaxID=1208324 RepID=A0A0B5E4J0_9RHOB|nr:hypothetical protein P73_3256 [Celeribacter indicus]
MGLAVAGVVRIADIEEEDTFGVQGSFHLIEDIHQGVNIAFDGLLMTKLTVETVISYPEIRR